MERGRAAARRAALSLSLGLAACGPAPRPPPPPVPARLEPGSPEARAALEKDGAKARALGAGALEAAKADTLGEGERLGVFVSLPAGRCTLVLARAAATVADVDLGAFDDEGALFASDESPRQSASLLLCPPLPRRLWLSARVVSGAGLVALGVYGVPTASAAALAAGLEIRGRPGEDTGKLEGWPGLEAALRRHRAAIGGAWEDVRRLPVPVSQRAETRLTLPIEAGRCIDVFALPSDEIAALDAAVESAAGRTLARGRDRSKARGFVVCSDAAVDVGLALRARGGEGLAAVVVGRSGVGAASELAPSEGEAHAPFARVLATQTLTLEAARKAEAARRKAEGYGAGTQVGTGSAKVGARLALPVKLPKGCARLDVVVGKPVADVAIEVWSDAATLLAEGRGGVSVPVFVCGPGGGAKVEVEALTRPGPIAVDLYAEPPVPTWFSASPRAASRLLARAADVGALEAARRRTQAFDVDEGGRRSVTVSVPERSCLDLLAAVDGSASGVELRVGADGPIVRGHRVTSDRVCAEGRARQVPVDVRVASGKAKVFFLATE